MNMTIEEPETDPVIHMAFPGGIDDLKEYVLELKGYKDHWVKTSTTKKIPAGNIPTTEELKITVSGKNCKTAGRWKLVRLRLTRLKV